MHPQPGVICPGGAVAGEVAVWVAEWHQVVGTAEVCLILVSCDAHVTSLFLSRTAGWVPYGQYGQHQYTYYDGSWDPGYNAYPGTYGGYGGPPPSRGGAGE